MDGEFTPLSEDLLSMGMRLNMAAANEHVPKVERQICVIKEHVWCIRHTLSFSHILVTMLILLVYHSVMWLNAFPPKGGVPPQFPPEASFQECPWISRSTASWLLDLMLRPMKSQTQPICSTQELWVQFALALLAIYKGLTSFSVSVQES